MKIFLKCFSIIAFIVIIVVNFVTCTDVGHEEDFQLGPVYIYGNAIIGGTLYVNVAASGDDGMIHYQWMRNGIPVNNNHLNNYAYSVMFADVGSLITVNVTHFRAQGSVTGYAPSTIPQPVVSIDGFPEVGQTLTAITDNIIGNFYYEWRKIDEWGYDHGIGWDNTYTVDWNDTDSVIYLVIYDENYSGDVQSDPTNIITNPYHIPISGSVSINGVVQVGGTLTVNSSNLNGSGTINYQWRRVDEWGNEYYLGWGDTYLIPFADVGYRIKVAVTSSDNYGELTSLTDTILQPAVYIEGIPEVGRTLTATTENIYGEVYLEWRRNYRGMSDNAVGSGNTYNIQEEDVDYVIYVIVYDNNYSGDVYSESTAVVFASNQTPAAGDYSISNLTQTVGSVSPVVITPLAGKSTGIVTVLYNGSTTLPATPGTYTVTFNVAAATVWNSINGLAGGTLTINLAAGIFGFPSAINTTYTTTLTLSNLTLPAGYVWNAPSTGLSAGNGQSFSATFTDPSGNYSPAAGNITVNVAKANGANVSVPTLASRTINSVTINAVLAPANGQPVQYAINTNTNLPVNGWQTGLTFYDLSAGTTYYIFARSAENGNYNAGTASSVLIVTTLQTVSVNRFEYFWVNEHGSLVITNDGITTISVSETLTITAQSTGYIVRQWHLNGVNTGQSGNSYDFSSATTGRHIVGLFVEFDGRLYNTNITITVQ